MSCGTSACPQSLSDCRLGLRHRDRAVRLHANALRREHAEARRPSREGSSRTWIRHAGRFALGNHHRARSRRRDRLRSVEPRSAPMGLEGLIRSLQTLGWSLNLAELRLCAVTLALSWSGLVDTVDDELAVLVTGDRKST